ncbi:restriction endonuclease subunit S [Lysobacter claricitrinus]|uniref:restriction endonuclease subunit S n=1 Tax=Lysobacter claricitrinus TaxID=3367728 RepID=UPI0037DB4A71
MDTLQGTSNVSNNKSLKSSWKLWRFDQMATNVNVRIDNPSESGMEHYVGLEHLDADSMKVRRWGTPDDVEATKLMFKKGDIIFGRRRAYQRKLGVAAFDGICSAHAMVLRAKPDVVLPEFLPFFMQSDLFMNRAVEISVGSLSPTVNWKTLAAQRFALPPINEQERLLTLFSAMDHGCNEFSEALSAAEALFESSLWNWTTGRLASKKRPIEAGEWSKARLPGINEIPVTWRLVRLTDVARLESGHTPSRRHEDYWSGDIPWISLGDTERLDTRRIVETAETVSQKGIDNSSARLLPRDTVVLCRTASVGFCSVMDKPMSTSQDFANFVCDTNAVLPDFLYFLFRAMRKYWKKIAMGGGIKTVYMPFFKEMQIALPPIEEQESIIVGLSSIQDAVSDLRGRLTGSRSLLSHVRDQALGVQHEL